MRLLRDIPKRLLGFKFLRRTMSVAVLAAMDGAALLFGLLGAMRLLTGAGDGRTISLVPLLVGAWVVVCAAFRLYDRAPVRRNPGALIGASACWAGLTLVGAAVYPESGLTLSGVLVSALLAFFCAGALRFFFEWGVARVYRRGLGQTPVLVVGGEPDRARVLRTMGRAGGAYVLAGEVGLEGGTVDLAAMRAALDTTEARIVVLAGAERLPDDELLELLRSMRLRGVPLRVAPGALALMRGRTILSESMGMPLLEVRYPQLDNSQRALKRALDVVISLAGILLLWPLFFLVALAVRLDSPGPALFRQKRVGADGKTFVCLMLRTMRADAEVLQEELEAMNEARGPIFKIKRDPRVTRVGGFLRRWSLDELPQLVNVLKGEMSLVGPRPLPVRDFLRMEEAHKRRLGAVPGMTGYWQISGRSDLSFEDMVRLDLYYIENWSLSFDLKIILKTLGAVLRREGAY
ncbi:exopolysaccharide biosynthesis polyprenyl glycosylphosphotransferase [Rubrobacter tropicus]|uniref:Exopolysaccharide biosynthesis polyprenyl glycosylphosphotransferase n=1 Tax=Rubrobacter tropicus TaxID=2653851 RepID=A0A6G8Q5I2_9ACTN|nr:sugar transferase [Rubrobacter tropicus]QIN81731.1 exopolysaccharide biosynthesis polyprenyl glycosylphosphotransferase [Rubrobacter tropicus]